jgi:HEAT repeat protein
VTTPSLRRTLATKAIDLPSGYGAVEELMRLLVKAIRAQQLYAANNPMHKQSLEALRTGFANVWSETPELDLKVSETELQWSGFSVLADPVKSGDSLSWMLYKEGIRDLRFVKGAEDSEIVRLLDILGRARKATIDDDDLVTMLWEADFAYIGYSYRDVQPDEVETDGISKRQGPPTDVSAEEIQLAIEQTTATHAVRSGVVNMADFDQTLYFLDEREADYLKQEIAREYDQDLRTNIVAALLDIFEQQNSTAIREECLDYVETMLAFLLASGNFRGVAYLILETRAAAARPGDLPPSIRTRIDALPDRLSAPAAVGQLLQSLDDAPVLPPRSELQLLFDQLRPAALATVFGWLPKVRDDHLRSLVADVAGRLAIANTAELVKLIDSPDVTVSNEAMRRAGSLQAQAAVGSLARTLTDPDLKRRFIATQALASIASAGALQALEKALGDTDREIRINAVRALALHNHRAAAARLLTMIRSREIREADITEKMAIFEGYGALSGDAGVIELDAILNAKTGFLGKRDDSAIRAAAAMGLGRNGTAKARDALNRAAADKDPVVRNAVAKALRGGR